MKAIFPHHPITPLWLEEEELESCIDLLYMAAGLLLRIMDGPFRLFYMSIIACFSTFLTNWNGGEEPKIIEQQMSLEIVMVGAFASFNRNICGLAGL